MSSFPMRCACDGVDVHSHVVPENFPAYIGRRIPADWPSMAPAEPCHRHVMIAGRRYRTVADKCWDAARRLEDLPGMGLSLQVLSPMPELLSYWLKASDAQQLLRFLNDQIATMVDAGGGRLAGLGAVPLQDIGLAIQELDYAVSVLGFAGVEVGSNINGMPIGAPVFDPFFEACESLGAAVFVHAIRPTGMDRLVGPLPLQQVLGYPSDVGLAAASVITGSLLLRRPGLRIAFSHGGGTLASLLPRLQQGWRTFPALQETVHEAPVEQARRLYYDTLVFDTPTLRHLVRSFGRTQLILGTDYPFHFREQHPLARLDEAGFDTATRAALAFGNAYRFLGRRSEEAPQTNLETVL